MKNGLSGFQRARGRPIRILYDWEIKLRGRPTPDVWRAQRKRINGGAQPMITYVKVTNYRGDH